MSDNLKPCPCCGGSVALLQCPIIPQDGGPMVMKLWLKCTKCCIQTEPLPFDKSQKVMLEWNRRTPIPPVQREQPETPINHTDSAIPPEA